MEDELMAFLAIDLAWPLMVRTVPDRIQRLAAPRQPDTKIAQAINGDDSIVNTPPVGVPGDGPQLGQWLIRRVNKPPSDRPGIPAPADSGRAASACPARRCRPDQPDLARSCPEAVRVLESPVRPADPGPGSLARGTHVRQLQLPPDRATGDHGRLPPVTPGHLGRRGRLIPVSSRSLHSQLKTSNLFLEIM